MYQLCFANYFNKPGGFLLLKKTIKIKKQKIFIKNGKRYTTLPGGAKVQLCQWKDNNKLCNKLRTQYKYCRNHYNQYKVQEKSDDEKSDDLLERFSSHVQMPCEVSLR